MSDFKYNPTEPNNTLFKLKLQDGKLIEVKKKNLIDIDDVEDLIDDFNISLESIISLLPDIITETDHIDFECAHCHENGFEVYHKHLTGDDKDYYEIFNVNWDGIYEAPEDYPPYMFEIRLFICDHCYNIIMVFLPDW
ncbi:MAG: hypothetical protein ACOC2W_03405 [bacterium]